MKGLAAVLTIVAALAAVTPAAAGTWTTPDNERLRAKVLRETPGLEQALARQDTYHASRLVMRWVATRVVWTKGPERIQPSEMAPGEIWYEWLSPLRTGVLCGGTAALFLKIMDLWGVPAIALDFAAPGGYTHVVALVPHSGYGTPHTKWGILDPTFSLEVVDRRGRTVTLDRIMSMVDAGRAGGLRARTGSLVRRRLLYHGRDSGLPIEMRRCGDRKDPACGLRWITRDRRLAGFRPGLAGYLRLITRSRLTGWNVPGEIASLYAERGLLDLAR